MAVKICRFRQDAALIQLRRVARPPVALTTYC